MIVDLVETETADGLRLHGALQSAGTSEGKARADAAILLHGVGSNFYSSSMMAAIAEGLIGLGCAALRVNTRGHDGLTTMSAGGQPRLLGAAMEVVDECRLDVAAWVDLLARRGYRRIAVLGHSLGAVKAVYSQSRGLHEAVSAVVAISPPRLSCSLFQQGPSAPAFQHSLDTAQRMLDGNRGEELFQATFPYPLLIAASAYIDKYGPAERYDILKHVEHVRSPALYVYGDVELAHGGVAFAGLDRAIGRLTADRADTRVRVIDGANHFYHGLHAALVDVIRAWMLATH